MSLLTNGTGHSGWHSTAPPFNTVASTPVKTSNSSHMDSAAKMMTTMGARQFQAAADYAYTWLKAPDSPLQAGCTKSMGARVPGVERRGGDGGEGALRPRPSALRGSHSVQAKPTLNGLNFNSRVEPQRIELIVSNLPTSDLQCPQLEPSWSRPHRPGWT